MVKIRRGDNVQVIKGNDKGKKGKVVVVFPKIKKALVEGINLVKKHKRKTREDQQGGIISLEAPISMASLMLLCKNCNRPVRVGFSALKDGTKSRVCKSCKEPI
ncbi:MAG: 50S ribosomal protein L24 [Candidatus Omnitrophica bacterium]|nr:50S ribosomal protein L24 [Candidatus Omnitrophota bacterium]MBI5145468.1 50S ribosomal protein L24 [Candidatus Omnitrophota bacterium]